MVKDYTAEVAQRWAPTTIGGRSAVESISGEQSPCHRDLSSSKSFMLMIFTLQRTSLHI